MAFPLSYSDISLAVLIVFTGSLIQGYIGYGMALISVPLLVLINPDYVPGPVILNGLLLTVLMANREFSAIRVKDLKWSIAGVITGSAAGGLFLYHFAGKLSLLNILTGIFVLAAVAASIWRFKKTVTINPESLIYAGTISGFMGVCSALGGPVIALLYQQEKGPRIRATLSIYFVFSTFIALLILRLIGKLGSLDTTLAFTLLPGTILGYLLSSIVKRFENEAVIRSGIFAVAISGSLVLIVKNLIFFEH